MPGAALAPWVRIRLTGPRRLAGGMSQDTPGLSMLHNYAHVEGAQRDELLYLQVQVLPAQFPVWLRSHIR
jgi:hypothetical protein